MKAGEVKMRLSNAVFNLVDTYFGGSAINEKFVNSTLKIIIKQNLYKIDSMLELFSDQYGEIDIHEIIKEYSNMIDEQGFVFDLKKYVDNDMIKGLIPNKVLIIKRDDILNILN
jgi:hypothetical protein